MSSFITLNGGSFGPGVTGTLEADLVVSDFSRALIADLEAVCDRFVSQCLAYVTLLQSSVDAAWTAVTGYYAAFFAVRALHAVLGSGTRRVSGNPYVSNGTYRFGIRPSVYAGRGIISLKKLGGSSHAESWQLFIRELRSLANLPALDPRSRAILTSLADIVTKPVLPSTFRNEVNYGLENASARPAWRSRFRDVGSIAVSRITNTQRRPISG